MFEAVIFDMDGVMIDSEIIYYDWLKEFLLQEGYDICDEELEKIVGLSPVQSEEMMSKLCEGPVGKELWRAYLEKYEDYPLNYAKMLNPGIRELLVYLKEHKVRTGLASASDMKDIREMLEDTGLEKYFDVILSGEMFEESKPDPEIYRRTAECLHTVPEKCIIIEDSDYGITAGKEAGAYVIAKEEKRFGFLQNHADIIAEDVSQIKEIIRDMLGIGQQSCE